MKILEVTFVQNKQQLKTFKMLTCQNSTYLTTKNGSKINSEFSLKKYFKSIALFLWTFIERTMSKDHQKFTVESNCQKTVRRFTVQLINTYNFNLKYSLNFFDQQCLLLLLYQKTSHCAHICIIIKKIHKKQLKKYINIPYKQRQK